MNCMLSMTANIIRTSIRQGQNMHNRHNSFAHDTKQGKISDYHLTFYEWKISDLKVYLFTQLHYYLKE